MKSGGYTLGGEQSGHVIMSAYATTGDGLLTALHVAEQMAVSGSSVSALASVMTRLPQVLVNVPGVDRAAVRNNVEVTAAVTAAEKELQGVGRVLLRPSGTEPLVRVMVEAPTSEQAQQVADGLAGVVRTHLAL
jgi:phosphoglucosamine mutase